MKNILAAAIVASGFVGAALADRGPVTNLPLPRYVSLKAAEGNVRRGPSLSHRIDWIFKHRNMPLQVIAEFGHWRRVVDREGAGGWVHYSLLSGARTVLIEDDMAPVFAQANSDAVIEAYFEAGAIARLGKCDPSWCRVTANGTKGYIQRSKLWGLLPGELRD